MKYINLIYNVIINFTYNISLAIIQYSKIDNLPDVIEKFKNKIPGFKPLKLRFYRDYKFSKPKQESKEVLCIKNLAYTVTKEELMLFLSEFAKPYYIALPRDQ